MKDVQKGLRLSIHTALNGNLSYDSTNVPVWDEKLESSVDKYVILSTQVGVPENSQQTFVRKASILIDIVDKQDNTVSKDAVDDISDQILDIIFPTTQAIGLTPPAGFQYLNAQLSDEHHLTLNISNTKSINRKLLTISADIIQQ